MSSLSIDQKFCEGCRKIDFEDIYNRSLSSLLGTDSPASVLICEIEHPNGGSWCLMCKFLSSFVKNEWIGHCPLYLRAYEEINYPGRLYTCIDGVVLAVHSDTTSTYPNHHYIWLSKQATANKSTSIVIHDTSGGIDWNIVKRWMKKCEGVLHPKCCAKALHCNGLTVIDCETGRLQPLPSTDTPFFTLSYVWGNSDLIALQDNGFIPSSVPPLIKDAMQAVLSLGFKYLWIDRYCIPQSNKAERHRLIQEMGRIYQESHMTLIASAGESPNDGLPGVSTVPRHTPQPTVTPGGTFMLTSIRDDFYDLVTRSKWNSRGWTYQEALLARRRLVFTEIGLYYQCQGESFYESIPEKPADTYVFPLDAISSVYAENCVRDLSSRHFTDDNDVLDALRGVLDKMRRIREDPIVSICGVPLLPDLLANPTTMTKTHPLARALLWKTASIAPQNDGESTLQTTFPDRRTQFPSWTWAGWKFDRRTSTCSINDYDYWNHEYEGETVVADIAVQYDDHTILQFEEDYDVVMAREASGSSPSLLRLQAWSFDLKDAKISTNNSQKTSRYPYLITFRFGAEDFTIQMAPEVPSSQLRNAECRAVWMMQNCILFVRRTVDRTHYERIGIGRGKTLIEDPWAQILKQKRMFSIAKGEWGEIILG